jgi:hypothetical protein
MATFERTVLRKTFGGTKINENWRKLYNKELMQLFGDVDIYLLVRINNLCWSGHVNRMDIKSQVTYLTIILR